MEEKKDIITMTPKELKRLNVISKVIDSLITQPQASQLLGLSTRQIRRIKMRVLEEGNKGIIHKLRNRASPRAFPRHIRDKVLTLCRTKYEGFNPTLAAEKLFEIDKIKISRETLRGWFRQDNIPYKTRKKRPHRNWRERKHYFGQLIQVDGSHHDWFEQRSPKCVLMAYIDDATGNVFARFYHYEGILPFMDSFRRYVNKYGLPQEIYIDRHTTYKSTKEPSIEDQLNNRQPQTQVQRALSELGVDLTFAYSAQAKGRIERLFRTFQDRLIKEMRLRNISNIKEANRFLNSYLPIYNRRFTVEPIGKTNLHRPLPNDIDLDKILCIKTKRHLNNDSTVVHNKRLYHVLDKVYTKEVIVEERIDGKLYITLKGKGLRYKEITQRPTKETLKRQHKTKKIWTPPMDHPWRRYIICNKTYPHINSYSQKEESSKEEKRPLLTAV